MALLDLLRQVLRIEQESRIYPHRGNQSDEKKWIIKNFLIKSTSTHDEQVNMNKMNKSFPYSIIEEVINFPLFLLTFVQ